MRRSLIRAWTWLESDPGPVLSLAVFLAAALALGYVLNALAAVLNP